MNAEAKEAAEFLNSYIEENLIKVAEVVKKHPKCMKPEDAAPLMGFTKDSLRTYLRNGGDLGVAWKKEGKQNHGYSVPTFQFLCKSYGAQFINIVREYVE